MISYNPNISNGTCYYTENTQTKGDFIPCGNGAIKAWPCCRAGSHCLGLGDSNACWDASSGNTYVAGCTDPSFGSPECLHKPPPFHDQEWVAISHACKNLNSVSEDVTNWTGCSLGNDSTELVKLPMASCTPYCSSTYILYAGSSSLAAYASLPTLSGSSIFWQNNFVPPTTPAAGYMPGTPTGVVPTFGPTATLAPTPGGSALSAGTKAGIGVGAVVGGLLLLALLAILLFYFVRRRRRLRQGHLGDTLPDDGAPLVSLGSSHYYYPNTTPYAPVNQPSPSAAAVYSGYKSELPANEQSSSYKEGMAHISELHG